MSLAACPRNRYNASRGFQQHTLAASGHIAKLPIPICGDDEKFLHEGCLDANFKANIEFIKTFPGEFKTIFLMNLNNFNVSTVTSRPQSDKAYFLCNYIGECSRTIKAQNETIDKCVL